MSEGRYVITFKYGAGYDSSWAVVRGNSAGELSEAISQFFGIPSDVAESLTPHELVLRATGIAHGTGIVQSTLGGTPITEQEQAAAAPDAPQGAAAWDVVEQELQEPAHPHAALIEALNSAPTVQKLQMLWAQNKDAFEDDDVKAAYQARGKALTAT